MTYTNRRDWLFFGKSSINKGQETLDINTILTG